MLGTKTHLSTAHFSCCLWSLLPNCRLPILISLDQKDSQNSAQLYLYSMWPHLRSFLVLNPSYLFGSYTLCPSEGLLGFPGWTQALKVGSREFLVGSHTIPSSLHFSFQKYLSVYLCQTSSLYFCVLLWWLFPLPWLCGSGPSSESYVVTLANQIWDSVSISLFTMSWAYTLWLLAQSFWSSQTHVEGGRRN